jgi:hypothetical protein
VKKNSTLFSYLDCICLLLAFWVLGSQQSCAQNQWDGDNPLGNLSYCSNWYFDVCPGWNSSTDLIFENKNNPVQTSLYQDIGWQPVRSIIYNTGFSYGIPFDGNGSGFDFYYKIQNLSAHPQIINIPTSGKGTILELDPTNQNLTFNQNIFNDNNRNYEVYGDNGKKLILNGYPVGNGSVGLFLKEYSIVEVNYNNAASLSGGYFIEEGEVWVNATGVIQGNIQVGNGNLNFVKLYISHLTTATTVANQISVPANSPNATIGALNSSNTHTYSGLIYLNNNIVNFDAVSTGTVNFTGAIANTGGIRKIGVGTARLSAANTYTGTTTINAGTLQLGATNTIPSASNVILNGGTLSTGNTTGFTNTAGTVALTDNSTIALGTGTHTLTFANSSAVAWTAAKTLTITGWSINCAGTGAKIFVGNSSSGLTAAQLAQITFQGYAPGASISTLGELIPGNVTLTATAGTLVGNYNTLKAAFDAINLGTHTGAIVISILNDTNEGTNTAGLNQNSGVTSVLIQPAGCGARTVTGTGLGGAGNPVIDINGADNVTIDGLNSGGNSLTITNTSTSNTTGTSTIRLHTDAVNNLITRCTVLGSATTPVGTNGGNIWFGADSSSSGNDSNTVSLCNIGPAGANLPTKAIYFSGTSDTDPGTANSGITITNNNIYDYFNAAATSTGVEIANGSTTISITNNYFYQTATRTQTTGATHSAIKIANSNGNGYTITGNTIGYATAAGAGTYTFVGVTGTLFIPITLTVGSLTATSVQGNTIAAISITKNSTAGAYSNSFTGINVANGTVNIGNVSGNTIGIPATPGTIRVSETYNAGGTVIEGINVTNTTGAGPVNIANNTIHAISTFGAVAATGYNFNGISVAGTAAYNITNNTIGNATAANSILLGTFGTTTGVSTVKGISSSSTGNLVIGSSGFANTIQNITLNAVAINNFTGITNSGASAAIGINYNTIKGIRFTSASATASPFTAISNTGSTGAAGAAINITNNTLGVVGTDLITYTAACSGTLSGISNTAGNPSADLAITNNTILGITHSAAGSSNHNYIANTAATLTQNISSNSFTNLNVNTTGAITFLSDGVNLLAAGTKNINSNRIVGAFTKLGATGSVTIYLDNASSATGSTINNTNNIFSGITVSGSTAVTGWQNTDGGSPTKTITGNTFNNWNLGSSAVTVLNVNFIGATSTVSSNTITNISCSNTIVGLNIGSSGTAATLNVLSNTIGPLTSSGTGGDVTGISNNQPNTTTINNTNSNVISDLSSSTGIVTGIINPSASPTKATNNNTISTFSSANNGAFRGIYVNSTNTTNTVTGNNLNGMTSSSIGTLSFLRALEVQGSSSPDISSNTILNLNSATTNTGSGVSTAIVGIYCGATGAAATVNNNTISLINATTAIAASVSVAGIATGNTGAGGTIAKNRVFGLTNTSTGANNFTAGFIPNGGNWTFANNMISITNNNTVQACGVFDAGATGARKYFYNSVYIGGTHAGTQVSAAFQFNAAAGSADIKNNIFVMARTSGAKNYAIANLGGSFSGFTCNYNVLNCTVAATVGTNGTDQNFASWKTISSGDANSFSNILVNFTNTAIANLHLLAGCTDVESGGTPIAVTDDYDASVRNATTPDIGADEYTGTQPAVITLTPNTPVCNGSGTTLTASSTDLTYAYTWSPGTGLSATTGTTVTASPTVTTTYTVTGLAPSGCTKSKDVTITVNPLPPTITVSPSTINVCANAIQSFTATASTATATVGTATGTSVAANTPYRQAVTTQERAQYLITKAELNAAGLYGGNITALGFNVTAVGTAPAMPSYVISMGNTPTASFASSTYVTTFTTVFSTTNLLPTLGLNTHTFSTAFAWDGTSNIVVNICHSGTGGGTSSTVSVSTPPAVMTNSNSGTGQCTVLTGTLNADRPVMTLTYRNPITWSPNTELYSDAAATTAYNPAVNTDLAVIYTKPTAPRVYTATATISATGCTTTNTGTVTMAASTWNGSMWDVTPTGNTSLIFTGNYTSAVNLSGCSCTVTSGNVTFNSPANLSVTNGVIVAAGAGNSLTIKNNASLIQFNDAATNSGIITMERITPPIYRFDYTYWGSPVTLASNFRLGGAGGLSPSTQPDKYYSWTPTNAGSFGNWAQESAATIMDPTKGYIVRAPQTFSNDPGVKVNYTANFVGTPNNGVVSCPIYHGTLGAGNNNDKYNLLGNPYPCAVDADKFLGNATNAGIIDGTIYFWTHNSPPSTSYVDPFYGDFVINYNASDYASWNKLGPTGSGTAALSGGSAPAGFIAAGQAFFTKSNGTAPSGNSVIFNNSMRVAGSNSQFFRNVHEEPRVFEKHRIWLNLVNSSGALNQILVGYTKDATVDWDRDFDGVRISEGGSAMVLYSIIPDRKLVIQGRPLPFDSEDKVPLGFHAPVQGNYAVRIDHVDGLFASQNIYIEDKLLNVIHDLKQSPYEFTATSGTFEDRLVLRYTDALLQVSHFEATTGFIAVIADEKLLVRALDNIRAIDVYDLTGKLICQYTPTAMHKNFEAGFVFAEGIYMVKIKLQNGTTATQKLINSK